MGLNYNVMNFLLKHNIFSNTDNNKDLSILEIGFLRNSMTPKQKNHLSQKYQVPIRVFEMTTHEIYYYFGYKYITSLDKSNFEGANFFKNLNEMPDENDSKFKQKFDLVIDGGTSEHVYNPIVAFANYFYFLKISGRLVQLLPVNNYIDHGIYQFSPTFFWSIDIAGIRLLNLNFRVNNIKPTDFYWDGNSKYFRSHLDGLWDGSTILNLFRFFCRVVRIAAISGHLLRVKVIFGECLLK
jgi:hypothetical protein